MKVLNNFCQYINILSLDVVAGAVELLEKLPIGVVIHRAGIVCFANSHISQVDLRKIIEQTFTDLGYLNGARETKRFIQIEGIDFYSDLWRVSEIFRDLISNAIKYRRPDSYDSMITIKINVDHLCADITFADNGIGIKDASLKRMFEMFYRATDHGDGSGIGLYIVKNAVEKLGGQIKVSSSPGLGTRFHILLPNRINI